MEQAFGLTIPRALEKVCDPRHLALLDIALRAAGIDRRVRCRRGGAGGRHRAPRAPPLRAGTPFAGLYRPAFAGTFLPARPVNPRD